MRDGTEKKLSDNVNIFVNYSKIGANYIWKRNEPIMFLLIGLVFITLYFIYLFSLNISVMRVPS